MSLPKFGVNTDESPVLPYNSPSPPGKTGLNKLQNVFPAKKFRKYACWQGCQERLGALFPRRASWTSARATGTGCPPLAATWIHGETPLCRDGRTKRDRDWGPSHWRIPAKCQASQFREKSTRCKLRQLKNSLCVCASIAAILLCKGVGFGMTHMKIHLHQLSAPQLKQSFLSSFASRINYFGHKVADNTNLTHVTLAADCDRPFQLCSGGGGGRARGYSNPGEARGNPTLPILLPERDMGKPPPITFLQAGLSGAVSASQQHKSFFFLIHFMYSMKKIQPLNEIEQRDSLPRCHAKFLVTWFMDNGKVSLQSAHESRHKCLFRAYGIA